MDQKERYIKEHTGAGQCQLEGLIAGLLAKVDEAMATMSRPGNEMAADA
jgi:hypothetical protein